MKSAWNDSFVHPDSTHWLKDGERLPLPGVTLRTGITNNIDVGLYVTKNPYANYGLWGGQVRYNLLNDFEANWAASARLSFVSLFALDDLDLSIYGLEVVASGEYSAYSDWVLITPYVGGSAYLTRTHETATAVDVDDKGYLGVQGTIAIVAQVSFARMAVEYNVAVVKTLSFKLGVGF